MKKNVKFMKKTVKFMKKNREIREIHEKNVKFMKKTVKIQKKQPCNSCDKREIYENS